MSHPLIPVTLLTGFLGSGKTTVLNTLLKRPEMGRTAVVINEFGEVGLDHLLVEASSEDVVLLDGGCLCCSIRSSLADTLNTLFLRRQKGEIPEFQRVVIESTGLADPTPILHTLNHEPLLATSYRFDGVIATVDAATGLATLNRQPEAVKQAAVADRILLTKSDLVGTGEVADLVDRLRAINPAAAAIIVTQGDVAPGDILEVGPYDPDGKHPDVRRWLNEEAYSGRDHHHHHGHSHHQHGHGHHVHDVNRHDDHIRAFAVTYERPILDLSLEGWLMILTGMAGERILRFKGIANVKGLPGPAVLHGVQHVIHPLVVLSRWPSPDTRSRFVFITRDLDRSFIEDSLKLLEFEPNPDEHFDEAATVTVA